MKFKAPEHITGGIDIGGGYFPIVDGVIELPDTGNYGNLLPPGFTQIKPATPAAVAAAKPIAAGVPVPFEDKFG